MTEKKIRILTLDNQHYDLNQLPDEVDELRFAILDNSNPVDPDYYFIEWDIQTLDECENIGIWCEEGTKTLRDYDGVFQLPDEAIELLKDNGFNTEYAE